MCGMYLYLPASLFWSANVGDIAERVQSGGADLLQNRSEPRQSDDFQNHCEYVNAFCLLSNVDIPALLLGHLLALLRQPGVEPGHLTDGLAGESPRTALSAGSEVRIFCLVCTPDWL